MVLTFEVFRLVHPKLLPSDIPVDSRHLSSASNCGFPGRWVIELTNTSSLSEPVLDDVTFYNTTRNSMGEPFLLSFGPEHGDFGYQTNTCRSLSMSSSFPFKSKSVCYFHVRLDTFKACTDWHVRFGIGCSSYIRYWAYNIRSMTHHSNDNLLDYKCTETVLTKQNTRNLDEFCPILRNYDLPWLDKINGVSEEETALYKDLIYSFDEETNIQSDDEFARSVMGDNSTKYVNLANNVFKRQTTNESDLTTVDLLVQVFHPGFTSKWALVATWYKMMPESVTQFEYNSYQVVITCNDEAEGGNDMCYIIFDYFQTSWIRQSMWGSRNARCGVKGNLCESSFLFFF